MNLRIEHDRERREFVTAEDGHRALLAYELVDRVMTIVHTGVPAAVANRGIAAELMRAALRAAEEEHWQVVADCSYARAFLQRQGGVAGAPTAGRAG